MMRVLCAFALMTTLAMAFWQTAEPTLPTAIAKIQTGDFAGALPILEAVTKRDPSNARAWRNLGLTLQKLKRYDESEAAYLTSIQVDPTSAVAAYNLGTVYALKNDSAHAFEFLEKSKALHMDLTNLQADPDLATLHSDPRYAALIPKPADFAHPFVEPVQVLREWDGEAAEDQFGWIARNLGDVDAGKAYIFSGKDGHVLQTFTAEDPADAFGRHVSSVGDVNRDGFSDVIVGAPGNNANGKGAGRAYIYSGKDGKLLFTLSGEQAGDAFGSTVAGHSDKKVTLLMVGAPGAGPHHTGRTYVYDGLTAKPKFTIESDDTGRALGAMFLSVPGDLDGDGFPDVYASDFSNAAKGPQTGRIYIHSGKDGHRLLTLTGETAGEGFGIGVAAAGDVDGDGRADLIIGSWQYGGAAVAGGRAYLYSGADGKLLKTYTCRIPGDTFGFDAVGMGDIDGDGTQDFLITSAWSGINGHHSGRMFIISSGVRRAK
jgi:hypothetical protein